MKTHHDSADTYASLLGSREKENQKTNSREDTTEKHTTVSNSTTTLKLK